MHLCLPCEVGYLPRASAWRSAAVYDRCQCRATCKKNNSEKKELYSSLLDSRNTAEACISASTQRSWLSPGFTKSSREATPVGGSKVVENSRGKLLVKVRVCACGVKASKQAGHAPPAHKQRRASVVSAQSSVSTCCGASRRMALRCTAIYAAQASKWRAAPHF